MIFAILLGIVLGTSNPPIRTALAVVIGFIIARAVVDIVLPKRLITGTPSRFVLYVQNLSASGDASRRPWLGYLVQSCLFYIPTGLVAFFVTRYFAH